MTLPVAVVHVGAIMTPGKGGCGVIGWAPISTDSDRGEMHSVERDTVKVYVP